MVYVNLRLKIRPVAMLSILAAKIMKPEYYSLISFFSQSFTFYGGVDDIVLDAYILI